ncbi:MAG: hypothetical protein ABSB70_20020 [Candidatus Velthaea sp.]|jgi:hypothetical protein
MQYETPQQHQQKDIPDEAARKLGSAQPSSDSLDAVGAAPAGVPLERVNAERLPREILPVEALPVEKQGGDYMTPETRPRDIRPREYRPV